MHGLHCKYETTFELSKRSQPSVVKYILIGYSMALYVLLLTYQHIMQKIISILVSVQFFEQYQLE